MYLFFHLIEEMGFRQERVARRMEISQPLFTRVKLGQLPPSPRFRAAAVRVAAALNLRHPDGRAFTEAELFAPVAVPVGTKSVIGETG